MSKIDLEKLKSDVKIISIARDLGFTVKRVGSFYTIKEHDSVRIKDKENTFVRYSTGENGSVIDFVSVFTGYNISDSIKYIVDKNQYLSDNIEQKNKITNEKEKSQVSSQHKQAASFVLPPKADNNKNVLAYLSKTRCIDFDVIKDFFNSKRLYQDDHNNAVFVSYDEENKPVFATYRGTNTNVRFLGDVKGSDYSQCFFIDNQKDELIITESVIDSMSIMSFKKIKGKDYKSCNYLALTGTEKYEQALNNHLNHKTYSNIVLALDNDDKGIGASQQIKDFLVSEKGYSLYKINIVKPKGKDFNDDLVDYTKKNISKDSSETSHLQDKKEEKIQVKEQVKKEDVKNTNKGIKEGINSMKTVISGKLITEPSLKEVKLKNGETVKRAEAKMNIFHGEGNPASTITIEGWNNNANTLAGFKKGDTVSMISHVKVVKFEDKKKTYFVMEKVDPTNTIAKQLDTLLTLYSNGQISQICEIENHSNQNKDMSVSIEKSKENNKENNKAKENEAGSLRENG